jgi:thiamine pyrophosphokinase
MDDTLVVIFANGEMRHPGAVRAMAQNAKLIIAADGGLTHIQALGLRPHLLIGDLDSVTPDQVRWAEEKGCEIRRFPAEKDETDLELALQAAEESGCRNVVITAALGGRLDQTLSNIFLMNLPRLSDLELRIDEGDQEVILILQSIELEGREGDVVSLLPLSPIVRGITTRGLRYPLVDESLVFYQSRGISNQMTGNSAKIQIQSGILLCIHTRSEEMK